MQVAMSRLRGENSKKTQCINICPSIGLRWINYWPISSCCYDCFVTWKVWQLWVVFSLLCVFGWLGSYFRDFSKSINPTDFSVCTHPQNSYGYNPNYDLRVPTKTSKTVKLSLFICDRLIKNTHLEWYYPNFRSSNCKVAILWSACKSTTHSVHRVARYVGNTNTPKPNS